MNEGKVKDEAFGLLSPNSCFKQGCAGQHQFADSKSIGDFPSIHAFILRYSETLWFIFRLWHFNSMFLLSRYHSDRMETGVPNLMLFSDRPTKASPSVLL
jgi:hypothetical protein